MLHVIRQQMEPDSKLSEICSESQPREESAAHIVNKLVHQVENYHMNSVKTAFTNMQVLSQSAGELTQLCRQFNEENEKTEILVRNIENQLEFACTKSAQALATLKAASVLD